MTEEEIIELIHAVYDNFLISVCDDIKNSSIQLERLKIKTKIIQDIIIQQCFNLDVIKKLNKKLDKKQNDTTNSLNVYHQYIQDDVKLLNTKIKKLQQKNKLLKGHKSKLRQKIEDILKRYKRYDKRRDN